MLRTAQTGLEARLPFFAGANRQEYLLYMI